MKRISTTFLLLLAAAAALAQQSAPQVIPSHVLLLEKRDDGLVNLLKIDQEGWWGYQPATAEEQKAAVNEPDGVRQERLSGRVAVVGTDASARILFRSIVDVPLVSRLEWDGQVTMKPIHDPHFVIAVPEAVTSVEIEGWQPLTHATFNLDRLTRTSAMTAVPDDVVNSCPVFTGPKAIMDPSRLNILVLGEGYDYTDANRRQFGNDVIDFKNRLFTTEPFQRYQNAINVVSFLAHSCTNGAYHPPTCQAGASANAATWPTAMHATYCGDDKTDRLLTIDNNAAADVVRNAVSGASPDIEVVLVNDSKWGGSGGIAAVVAVRQNPADPQNLTQYAPYAAMHEIGHTFGHLGDEYEENIGFAGGCETTCPANIIQFLGPPPAPKWSRWLGSGSPVCRFGDTACAALHPRTPGLFEGAYRAGSNFWRPEADCIMRHSLPDQGNNYKPPPNYYCHICTEEVIRWLYLSHYSPLSGITLDSAQWAIGPLAPGKPAAPAEKFKEVTLGFLNLLQGFASGPDWSYTWHKGTVASPVIPGENTSRYRYTPMKSGQDTFTLEVNDPTDMVREDGTHPKPLHMKRVFTWVIPTGAGVSAEDDDPLGAGKTVKDILDLPDRVRRLILHYSVKTAETNRLHGDTWHIAVTTPSKTLLLVEKTAFGPQDETTDAEIPIDISASTTFPLTVQIEVSVKNGENSDGGTSEPMLPTTVTASLYGEPDGCAESCDYCAANPTDPSCPLNVGITVTAIPIGDTSKTHNHGDSTYSSLGERIGEGRYVTVTMPSFLTEAGMFSVEFIVEALKPDNTVLAKVRDVAWYANNPTWDANADIVWVPSAHAFSLNISPKHQFKDQGIDYVDSGPYATGSHTDPIPESLWTHTMKYRITVRVIDSNNQLGTSSALVETINSPITPQQPNDLAVRPLHALWHTPLSHANGNYWASLYMHNWLKSTHLPLNVPGEIADEDAVDSTAPGHEYGTAVTEAAFYGISYLEFRFNATKALPSNSNTASRLDAREKIRTWINATRAHLEALLPDRAISSVSIGDGGKCGGRFSDPLPDGWMKSLLMSSTVTDSGGNVILDVSDLVGPWNTAPLEPLFLPKLTFSCNRNSDIDILVDRCVIGELPLGPCNPSRHIKAPTSIITPPDSRTIDPGGSAFLEVVADGTNLRYQWYQGALSVYGFPMIGETSDHITVSPTESTAYWVLVSGDDGVSSAGATVTVNGTGGPCTDPPTITSQPVLDQYITESGAAFMGVSATGTSLHYQWYLIDYFGQTSIVGGQTLSTLTTTTLGSYFCRVSNGCGSVDSNRSDVLQGSNCLYPGSLVYPPSSSDITIGDHVDLSLFASGKPPIDVTWYEVMPDTGLPVPVASGASVTVTPTNDPSKYLAILSNECGAVQSSIVTINVCTPPAITTQPAGPATMVENSSFLLGVGATGSRLHYHWTANGAPYGTDSPNLIIGNQPVTTTYLCTIDNECGQVVTMAVVVSPPCPPISATIQPANGSIISGQSIVLSATLAGTVTALYQWVVKVPGSASFSDISNATGTSVTVSPTVDGTQYAVRIGNGCSTVTSDPVTIAVISCLPPSIVQTYGASIAAGQTSTISVSAAGSGLHYAWYLGNPSDTSNPLGGTVATLSMPQGIAGTRTYWVRVSGLCGTAVDSGPIVVHVCATPSIDVQPVNVTVFSGQQATFSVSASEASGEALHYQWSFNGAPVGTDSPSYTTPPVTQPGQYSVHVSSGTCSIDSSVATVSVCTFPQTIVTGTTQNVAVGQSVTLNIGAITPATGNVYTWYAGPVGDFANSGQISYNSSPTYTFTATAGSGGTYWATVSRSDDGCTSHTDAYTVSVCIPTITQQPAGVMINSGQSTTLTVAANTTGLTYQWYTGASGNTSAPISGATNASYSASPTVATSYWVRVTGICAQSVDSNTATVTICQPPSAISVSGGGEIVRGQSTTLFASSTGTSITYQWYVGSSGDTSSPINAGAQSITVTPQDRTNYWVRVTGTCGSRDSATVTVSVCAVPTITSQPQGLSIFSGSTATLSVSATVATATPLTYQWYIGASGTTTSPISGATGSSYTTPVLTADTSYWVAVSSDICGPVLSDASAVSMCPLGQTMTGAPSQSISLGQTAHLAIPPFSPSTGDTFFWYQGASGDTSHPLGDLSGDWGPYNYLDVSPAVTTQYWAQIKNGTCVSSTGTTTVSVCIPTITQHPAGIMINSGQTTTLTVAANTAGLTYQWYRGSSGDTSAPVGTNSPSFTTPALTVTTSYWVKVTGTCGQSVNSNTATVTICQIPAITVQPFGTSLVRGYSTTLSVSATGTNLSYQWYLGTSGNTSSPLAGNTSSYAVTNPQNPVDYWVKVTGTCGSVNSATAHISVCTTPTITTQPLNAYTFSGSSATLSVSASEATSETLHYQWHKGTTSPVNVGTDSPTYNTGALSADTSYYVTVTAGICSVDSAAATVSICMYPQTVTGAPNANTSPGQSVRLTIASNPGVTSYLWYRGASGDTSSPITGWQAANYIDVAPATTTNYWAQWQANSGSCISNTTTTTVSVCIPVITTQPANVTIASGSTTLSVVSNLPGSTYQWYVGASGTTTSPISGATSASVTVSPGATTSYWCRVSGSCATANSNTATVTICSPPVITHQPTNWSTYSGQSSMLAVTATGTNLTYQWYVGASGNTSNPVGITASSIQGAPTSSVQYWVKVTGTCGSVNSNSAWMSVYPGIIQQPQQTTYLSSGSKGNLYVNATGTGLHYQWWGDSGPVAGAPDSPNFITPNITGTSSYYCFVSSSGGATVQTWAGTFYLCDGVPISSTTVTNAGGNCRYLIPNVGGSYDSITWYQGQRGDTSVQVGTGSYLYVCPSTSTTYWFRAFNTDSNQQVSCYSDSATTTVP